MRPRLINEIKVVKPDDRVVVDTLNAIKNDIKENIFTRDTINTIKFYSINLFGLFITVVTLYLFYNICLENYKNEIDARSKIPEIYPYNFN